MTDDHTPQSATASADNANPDPIDSGKSPAKKASPRRKIGTRSKAAVVVKATDDAAVSVPKVRRPRAAKSGTADGASPNAPAVQQDKSDAVAPAAQPKVFSPGSPGGPESQEARIETQVIQPAEFARLEEKSARQFEHPIDGSDLRAAPADVTKDSAPASSSLVNDAVSRSTGGAAPSTNPGSVNSPEVRPETGADHARGRVDGDGASGYPRPDRQDRPSERQDHPPDRGNSRPERSERQGQFNNFQPQGRHDRQDRHERFNRHDRPDRQDRAPGQGVGAGPAGQQGQGGQPFQQGGGADPSVSRVVEPQFSEGIVEVSGKGFGFLREAKRNFVQTPADVFVTPEVCRKYNLRDGQWIKGEVRRSSRGPQLFRLTALNGEDPEKFRNLPNFEELTTINPRKRIKLETVPERYTTRVMDLMTPIGKGQRGLLVAPPRTGKTTLLQHIAEAVIKNHPEMKIIILLVDERPEEVTEMRRTVPQAEIMASSNDSDLKSHTRIAQLAMERSKRLVEAGFDVFMLLDSITRMGRAFNNTATGSRTGSGGIDSRALEIPRKIFAAARNTEEAGSLTIMATALIETGSRGDEVIFQEFKGTGNMELVLDRKISDQRIYPAVDIFQSGTRREELLLQPWELDKINVIRRGLAGHKPLEAIERLLSFLKKFPTNAQMLTSLPG